MLKLRIENRLDKLSSGQVDAARFILKNPGEAAFLTASQIGSRAGVSESTVIRLAGALGYSGFPELKSAVQKHLMEHLSTLERYKDYENAAEEDFLERIAESAQKTISLTRWQVDRAAIKDLSSRIITSPAIFIFGQKSSYSLAFYLSYYLSWFLPNTHLLDSHLAFERIAGTGKNTLAIGISFPRFSGWTNDLLNFAREEGIHTAAITSDFNSPLSEVSDCVVSVPWNPISFIDSFTAPLCVINAVILTVAHEMGEHTNLQLEKLERVWEEKGIYTPGD